MKFLYVDIKNKKLVALFQNTNGQNFYWDRDEVIAQKAKHQTLSSWAILDECDEALADLDLAIQEKKNKPWWKFW